MKNGILAISVKAACLPWLGGMQGILPRLIYTAVKLCLLGLYGDVEGKQGAVV